MENSWDLLSEKLKSISGKELIEKLAKVYDFFENLVKEDKLEPLTDEERSVIEEEKEDDDRFYDLMEHSSMIDNRDYILQFNKEPREAVNYWLNNNNEDSTKAAVDLTIKCWDWIVPEYYYHQLSHLLALVHAQIAHSNEVYHERTWLIKNSNDERIELFLKLARELDLAEDTDLNLIDI